MSLIIRWLTIALPFLVLAQNMLLLINPSIAAGLQEVIDALNRVIGTAKAELSNIPHIAKGLHEITVFGENVITILVSLKTSDLSKEEKIKQANRLFDSLFDKNQVTQAKNGSDGKALADFKTKALALRTEIINS